MKLFHLNTNSLILYYLLHPSIPSPPLPQGNDNGRAETEAEDSREEGFEQRGGVSWHPGGYTAGCVGRLGIWGGLMVLWEVG